MAFLTVSWISGDAEGYTDWLPLEAFRKQVSNTEGVHEVRGPRGGVHHARYKLNVRDVVAELDYGACEAFNSRNGMQLGKLTCEFTDTDRKEVKHLRWNGKSISSSEAKVVITTEMPGAVERKGDSALRFGQRTLRPDQAAFRDEVMRVYGGECCLTGCAVPFALEAAHIAPFTDGGPDAAANGLLLRADLHALMDSGHLAIDPATRKVHFSPEARHWPEYARLHGRRRLRAPQAGYEDRAPGRKALALRWDAFKSITATF